MGKKISFVTNDVITEIQRRPQELILEQFDEELPIEDQENPPQEAPREVPLRFGYMRLAEGNPYAAEHRAALLAAGIEELFDDSPAVPYHRPQFDKMLSEMRPHDVIVLVKLRHFTTNSGMMVRLLKRVCDRWLDLRLIGPQGAGRPASTALLNAYIAPWQKGWSLMCGGDGGSGD